MKILVVLPVLLMTALAPNGVAYAQNYPTRPYDALNDFTAISGIANSPTVLMVASSVPAHSVKELIALSKAKPGYLNFGSSGVGTQFHLSGELLKLLAGIDMVHIPYKG